MTAASAAPLPPTVAPSRPANDIAVTLAAAVLWLLLALFVVYPLAMLFARMLGDRGAVDFAALGALLTDKHQVRAFWNSLLLAFLVGIAGTLAGFLFAFAASTKIRAPRRWRDGVAEFLGRDGAGQYLKRKIPAEIIHGPAL